MKIAPSYYKILYLDDGVEMVKRIEKIARISYKSEGSITENSYKTFVKKLINSHHDSCLEQGGTISVLFYTDRGVSHEIVRHRIASFNQESTRYANFSKDKFGNEITVIDIQEWLLDRESFDVWYNCMLFCEQSYMNLIKLGNPPQIARSVLPTGLKTEIVVSTNPREWRHIFLQRCDRAAHPQIRELMLSLLKDFHDIVPVLFDDIYDKFFEEKENI